MHILGMSYMYHDSAACLLRDGDVVAAAAEERFARIKHTVDFPTRSIDYVLQAGGVDVNDLEAIVFYEKPYLKFERILRTHLAMWPRSWKSFRAFLPMWLNYKLAVPHHIRENTGYKGKIYFTDHHYAHAASAYVPSPFERSLLLTTDGTGEWSTLTFGKAEGRSMSLEHDIKFPHSLGLLYSAVTAHLGFKVNNGEGKVMGLASYGDPSYYAEKFAKLIDVRDDGSFRLDLDYFAFHYDLVMTSPKFAELFFPPRVPESALSEQHMHLAAALQHTIEQVLFKVVRTAHKLYGIDNLCIAGGVGLNCVANGKLLENTPVKEVFVQPASGDDGGSMGGALYLYLQMYKGEHRWRMEHSYLGPEYSNEEIGSLLRRRGAHYELLDDATLVDRVSALIADDQILGWFQGRMEFGPRSLGNRSILANPVNPDMQNILNAKVKHRESFRPFAPAVLAERCEEFFELGHESPYMLMAGRVKDAMKARVPSITHVDGTARIQTVTHAQNPRFYELIKSFGEKTGVPILINTSFNVRGEPIVCTPSDAHDCFMRTKIDYLVLGNYLVRKVA
jgi:carbamoyltransferase